MSFKSWDNYEITTEKVGVEGTKFVKVWGFGKTVDDFVCTDQTHTTTVLRVGKEQAGLITIISAISSSLVATT